MSATTVDRTNPAFPLTLTIWDAQGGIDGEAPTVAVRDGSTTGSYLDFSDNTFKTSGWVVKDAALTPLGDGRYHYVLNVAALAVAQNDVLIAEYKVDGGVKGVGTDLFVVTELEGNLQIVRQSITNRMEQFPGNPGTLILYDDDGVTPLLTWQLRDATGGAIVAFTGAAARRSAGA